MAKKQKKQEMQLRKNFTKTIKNTKWYKKQIKAFTNIVKVVEVEAVILKTSWEKRVQRPQRFL